MNISPLDCYQHLYSHGFASSIKSAKALYFQQKYRDLGLNLHLVDFNQPDFYHLTLTRQITQIETILKKYSPQQFIIIGSSFGGLTANWIAHLYPHLIKALILLAPAFNFVQHLSKLATPETLIQWQQQGELSIYHYGEKKELPLKYDFWQDLNRYDESIINHQVPTLIFHGQQDETIPIQSSYDYQKQHPHIILHSVEGDHSLYDYRELIWYTMIDFLQTL